MTHMNYFEPYQSKAECHEDQLTRAYLVVLRYSPAALLMFYDYATRKCIELATQNGKIVEIPRISCLTLSNIFYDTQVTDLTNIVSTSNRLLSVLITDEKLEIGSDVSNSNRGARYDGVVSFSSDITLIIENKPHSYNVWKEQLSPHLDKSTGVEIISVASILEWKQIIKNLNTLINLEAVSGAEKIMITDFLDYIDKHFMFLNPYDNLSLCKNDEGLLRRRTKNILEKIVEGKTIINAHRGWNTYKIETNLKEVRMVGLTLNYDINANTWSLDIALYYGDTMNQARAFYERKIDYNKIKALVSNGWEYRPNFHISFIQKHLVWFETKKDDKLKEKYYIFWQNSCNEKIRQYGKKEIDVLLKELYSEDIIKKEIDVENIINDEIKGTNRENFNICPGFGLLYHLSSEDAIALDSKGTLIDEIRKRIDEGLSILGVSLQRCL
ncbi:MAG: hypothetical protein HQK92_13695 [Nitrospirae bacterium]|nr:hypothetical protein [Nitrospirota bacterium]